MTKIYAITARILLGLVLVVAVLFRLFASPQLIATMGFPTAAQNWLDVMKATGYLQTLLYTTELVAGTALLIDFFIPLVLIALAPVILNIALFHIFLDARLARIALVAVILGTHLLLVYIYR
jgi:uncharacterized membrane protein YphA (DoxX/SURF4 family)